MDAVDSALTSKYIVESYQHAFQMVYARTPSVQYMGNQWYKVNGELVHRSVLMQEVVRLQELERKRHVRTEADRSIVRRLIAKLRGL